MTLARNSMPTALKLSIIQSFIFFNLNLCKNEGADLRFSSENFLTLRKQLNRFSNKHMFLKTSVFFNNINSEPDAKKNLTELILSQGYPVETYTVETKDGFLLDLHRIPHGRNDDEDKPREPVLLMHGLLSSACDWVMNFRNDSLGFMLVDAGYDVWMGNSRGNTYSRKHVRLSERDPRFWDWSFDQMASYDLPSFIDFVLHTTQKTSLFYVGHSQGTLQAFALLSERPEYQPKIKLFVGLAPVTNVSFIKSPIKILSKLPDNVLYDIFGRREILTNNYLLKWLIDLLCVKPFSRWVCSDILFLFAGPDTTYMNKSRIDVYISHSPAGASVKNFIHFAQLYRQQRFQKYDFGSVEENTKKYGQPTPPEYNVSKVNVPVVAFTGTRDWLADMKDAENLFKQLPDLRGNLLIPGYNHLDFIWAENAASMCYIYVLDWMSKYQSG